MEKLITLLFMLISTNHMIAQMKWEVVSWNTKLSGGPDTCDVSFGSPIIWGDKWFTNGVYHSRLTSTNHKIEQYIVFGYSNSNGETWKYIPSVSRVFPEDYYLLNSVITPIDSVNAVCGGLPYIWHTSNGGESWDTVKLVEKANSLHDGPTFNKKGQCVFGSQYSGVIPMSMDRGKTWSSVTPPDATSSTILSASITENGTILCTESGYERYKFNCTFYRLDSSKTNWLKLGYSVDDIIRDYYDSARVTDMRFVTDSTGYSIVSDWSFGDKAYTRRLLKTVNQGSSWKTVFETKSADDFADYLSDYKVFNDTVIVTTNLGRVFYSVNGGILWDTLVKNRAVRENGDFISYASSVNYRGLREGYLYASTNAGYRAFKLVPDVANPVLDRDTLISGTTSSFITTISTNPADNFIRVGFFSIYGSTDEGSTLKVYNIFGECVLDLTRDYKRISSRGVYDRTFAVDSLQEGFYLLVVSDKKSIYAKSLVIHR